MRVLITGSRDWTSVMMMNEVLGGIPARPKDITIVHGGARGADTIAGLVANSDGMNVEVHPADWERYGKSAGPRRNAEMAALGADFCLAFLKRSAENRGTKGMIGLCQKAGIPVTEYWED